MHSALDLARYILSGPVGLRRKRRNESGYCGGLHETNERWTDRQRERGEAESAREGDAAVHARERAAGASAPIQTRRFLREALGVGARKRPAGVPGSAWHVTGCRSRSSPTSYRAHLPAESRKSMVQ